MAVGANGVIGRIVLEIAMEEFNLSKENANIHSNLILTTKKLINPSYISLIVIDLAMVDGIVLVNEDDIEYAIRMYLKFEN